MFKDLDPLLHSQLRLGIMSILMAVEHADFTYLKEKTNATAGNVSVQIDKLEKAGYIKVAKSFRDKRPLTTCKISKTGIAAFEKYVNHLKTYINK
ncbi:MAG: transcriptional regulator [Flavobacteriales bacterium]|nr:transcriptional regulator [Flavobacteriales bacterium]